MLEGFSIIISLKLFAKKKIRNFEINQKRAAGQQQYLVNKIKKGKIYFKLNLGEVTTMSVMAHLFIYYIETKFIKFTI
jgi:hypothetical protein